MNNEEHYTEIDLTALLKALWRHIWLIAASVIVIGAMAFSYARFFRHAHVHGQRADVRQQ